LREGGGQSQQLNDGPELHVEHFSHQAQHLGISETDNLRKLSLAQTRRSPAHIILNGPPAQHINRVLGSMPEEAIMGPRVQ
jgi:hypothetical protein